MPLKDIFFNSARKVLKWLQVICNIGFSLCDGNVSLAGPENLEKSEFYFAKYLSTLCSVQSVDRHVYTLTQLLLGSCFFPNNTENVDASVLCLQLLQKLQQILRKSTTRQTTLPALPRESQTQESHGLTSQVTWTKPCVDWLELKRRCWWTLRVELTRGCVQQRMRLEPILRTSHSLVSLFVFSRTLQLHCEVSLLS